jgi:aspartate/methionine/tyrosine aminotransferase
MQQANTARLNPNVVAIPASKREAIWTAMKGKDGLANLASGNPEWAMPPSVVSRIQTYLQAGYARYTGYYGFDELRDGIAAKMKSDWSVTVHPRDELIVTNGVQEGLYVVMGTILQPEDEVIIPSPHYGTYYQNTLACGAKPVLVPLKESEGFLPDAEKIAAAVTPKSRAIVFCNPNNPLGVVWPRETLEALAQVALEHDLLVLVDEIYRDFADTPPVSIAALPEMRSRTFSFGGFSKSHVMMGLRIGFVTGPAALMDQVKKMHYCVALCPPVLGQVAAQAALECTEEELVAVRDHYKAKLAFLYKSVARFPGVSCVAPGGGFYVFPNFTAIEADSMALAVQLIEEAGVVTLPGTEFGDLGQGYLRLSVCAAEADVDEGVHRLEKFVAAKMR